MRIILTSTIGRFMRNDKGIRMPDYLYSNNGFLEKLKSIWREESKVLIVASSPKEYEKNDAMCLLYKESFCMSGLSVSSVEICDGRNTKILNRINEMDAIMLAGGDVPTQNKFFEEIELRKHLKGFEGTVIACSAGAMNCAETVYAAPEPLGEATDLTNNRWLRGLGLTDINILPHFQNLRDEWLDGLRLVEDIIAEDSIGHKIIAINDRSYILIEDGKQTVFGEAYIIKDGKIEQICRNEMAANL